MSKQEKGRLYASEESKGWRIDNWDEDLKEGGAKKDPKKEKKKNRNKGGSMKTFNVITGKFKRE